MATRYYFRDTTANVGTLDRLSDSVAIPASGETEPDSSDAARDLSLTAGTGTARYTPPGAGQTAAQDVLLNRYVSPVVAADTFASPSVWTCAWAVSVGTSGGATASAMTSVYVVKSDDSVRGFIYDAHALLGNTWPANDGFHPTGRVFTFNGAAVPGVLSTDKLVVEVWAHATQSVAVGDSYRFEYDGSVIPTEGLDTGNDAASYVEYLEIPATSYVRGFDNPARMVGVGMLKFIQGTIGVGREQLQTTFAGNTPATVTGGWTTPPIYVSREAQRRASRW